MNETYIFPNFHIFHIYFIRYDNLLLICMHFYSQQVIGEIIKDILTYIKLITQANINDFIILIYYLHKVIKNYYRNKLNRKLLYMILHFGKVISWLKV